MVKLPYMVLEIAGGKPGDFVIISAERGKIYLKILSLSRKNRTKPRPRPLGSGDAVRQEGVRIEKSGIGGERHG